MKVNFVDLKIHNKYIFDCVESDIRNISYESQFILSDYSKEFEDNFAKYCGVKYCVGLGSGTDANMIAVRILKEFHGIEKVILPANTFYADFESIISGGCEPVIVDIDSRYNINVGKLEIGPKTAIMPTHLYGSIYNVDEIKSLGIFVIEDACQAHGSVHRSGSKAGSFGNLSSFSFYPTKNLGAFGDGGALLTNDVKYATYARHLRDHGSTSKNEHTYVGYNSRLDSIQAVVLNEKLKYLHSRNELRVYAAKLYNDLLVDIVLRVPDLNEGIFHLYVIEVNDRCDLKRFLGKQEISTAIHYPNSIGTQEHTKQFILNDIDVAIEKSSKILSLPMYPEIKDEEIHYVCDKIKEFVK